MGFEDAVTQVLKDEGGYFENEKTGEIVNFGITLKFVQGVIDRKATKEFIKTLTSDAAKQIYKEQFWDKQFLDKLKSDKLASLLFYLGVNMGTPTATFMAQTACHMLGAQNKVDGFMGSKTVEAINSVDPIKLYSTVCKLAEDRYRDIVTKNPIQQPYLAGWLTRLDRYRKDIPISA